MTNKEIAKAWYSSVDAQDFDTLRSLMADNHSFSNPMSPTPVGLDEHIGIVQMMTGSLSGTHHIDLLLEDRNHVVVKGHWTGKHTGEFNGVPATGNDVNFTFVDIFQVENGKVSKEHLEMNPAAIMAQITA